MVKVSERQPSEFERRFTQKLNEFEARYGARPDVIKEQELADEVGNELSPSLLDLVISLLKRRKH